MENKWTIVRGKNMTIFSISTTKLHSTPVDQDLTQFHSTTAQTTSYPLFFPHVLSKITEI